MVADEKRATARKLDPEETMDPRTQSSAGTGRKSAASGPMALDALIHERVRLGIVSALALAFGALVVWAAMLAARRYPVRRLWSSLGWLVTAIFGVLLLAGLGVLFMGEKISAKFFRTNSLISEI